MNKLIDTGAVAADYYMVAILDRPQNENYSSRAGGAAYHVADKSSDAVRRFHAALYAQQPSETATSFPTNAQLIETASQAGAAGKVSACINSGRYTQVAQGLAKATGIQQTPTVRINGQDYETSTPEALVAKIREIVGDVPCLWGWHVAVSLFGDTRSIRSCLAAVCLCHLDRKIVTGERFTARSATAASGESASVPEPRRSVKTSQVR